MKSFSSSTREIPPASEIPRHIAVIMDGNGRWAKKRYLPRVAGHKQGVETVRRVTRACSERGVEYLTLFAFSSENWRRPAEEVSTLKQLFMAALEQEAERLHRNKVRLKIIGDIAPFGARVVELARRAQELTSANSGLTLTIAANYGGRWRSWFAAGRCPRTALPRSNWLRISRSITRPNPICSSAPEGSSASAISCFGSSPTPNFTSLRRCGRTSTPGSSTRRLTGIASASVASGGPASSWKKPSETRTAAGGSRNASCSGGEASAGHHAENPRADGGGVAGGASVGLVPAAQERLDRIFRLASRHRRLGMGRLGCARDGRPPRLRNARDRAFFVARGPRDFLGGRFVRAGMGLLRGSVFLAYPGSVVDLATAHRRPGFAARRGSGGAGAGLRGADRSAQHPPLFIGRHPAYRLDLRFGRILRRPALWQAQARPGHQPRKDLGGGRWSAGSSGPLRARLGKLEQPGGPACLAEPGADAAGVDPPDSARARRRRNDWRSVRISDKTPGGGQGQRHAPARPRRHTRSHRCAPGDAPARRACDAIEYAAV